LILHNNANYKKLKTHDDILALDSNRNSANRNYEKNKYLDDFTSELVVYLDNNIPNIFKSKKDIDVAFAIVELMKNRTSIENFNKKSLYILIREMTDVNTSHITKVTNVLKKHYKKMLLKFEKYGSLMEDDNNKFF
jgi:hypothetical protein